MIHTGVYFASARGKLKEESKSLSLLESAIYCATVDQQTEILEVCGIFRRYIGRIVISWKIT